jgi:hypothetical protein
MLLQHGFLLDWLYEIAALLLRIVEETAKPAGGSFLCGFLPLGLWPSFHAKQPPCNGGGCS